MGDICVNRLKKLFVALMFGSCCFGIIVQWVKGNYKHVCFISLIYQYSKRSLN